MSAKTNRGGVIPYYRDQDGTISMLFMKPSNPKYGGSSFQIAKGKVDEGEDTQDGAFREAQEELGLFTPNTKNVKKLGTFLGRTTIYIAEVIDPSPNKFGDYTSETGEIKWMTADEFQVDGRSLHKSIVKAAMRIIQSTNQ
jgi:predicted NUDIX family NTP pyrophosphohydrolase